MCAQSALPSVSCNNLFSPHLLHELFQHCFSLSKGQRKLILLLIESAKFVVLCAYFIPQRSCIFIL